MSFERDYAQWKGWAAATLDDDARDVFERECARAGLLDGARVLEVGFGAGLFLDWAKQTGYDVVGVDTNAEACRIASARGHRVECHDLQAHDGAGYQAIVAFDVLEHLDRQQLIAFGRTAASKLEPGGVLLARFPNGASPFGRQYQHSDPTHQIALTPTLVEALFRPLGFALVGAWNSAQPRGTELSLRLVRTARSLLRASINHVTSWAYFGRVVPFDPNVTVVLRKQ